MANGFLVKLDTLSTWTNKNDILQPIMVPRLPITYPPNYL
jgi:hypothetical protein